MYLLVEKGIREGVFYIHKGRSKINDKYVQFYDYEKPSKYIAYLHANNFYGSAMSQ